MARSHTAEAIETLVRCMRGPEPRAAIAAAEALLNRGWGRPSMLAGRAEDHEESSEVEARREELVDRLLALVSRQGS